MSPFRSIATAAIYCMIASPSWAETLEEAWALGLSSDQSLQAVRTETTAAESGLAAAKSNRMPVLDVDSNFTQLEDSLGLNISLPVPVAIPNIFSNNNFVTAGARLSVPLYTSGLISSGIDAAGAMLDATRARETAFVEDIKLAVAESFVTVLRAERAVEVASTNVTSLQAHATDVDNLFQRGLVPRNDLLAVQVSLADATQTELQANNALDVARAAYNRRLGRDLETSVTLDEIMPTVSALALSENVQTLTASALNTRTELRALTDQANALRHQADAERARSKPQFAASAGYTYLENNALRDQTFASASVGFTWSLFDGSRSKHRAGQLERQAQSVSELRQDAISSVRLQVRSAWLTVQEVSARLTVTEQATTQAEENLRVARNRYQNGIGTNTEVLDAETLRALTHSNHNNARYDAALARLRLARAIGVL